MNCLDFDSFIYKIAIQNRKEKKNGTSIMCQALFEEVKIQQKEKFLPYRAYIIMGKIAINKT